MHARITRYELKPDKLAEAQAVIEKIRPQIMCIPGLQEYLSFRSYDGIKHTVITIYESKAHAEAAIPRALQLWVKLTDFMASTPESGGYEVSAHAVRDDRAE